MVIAWLGSFDIHLGRLGRSIVIVVPVLAFPRCGLSANVVARECPGNHIWIIFVCRIVFLMSIVMMSSKVQGVA